MNAFCRAALVAVMLVGAPLVAQQNRIDTVTPLAPELAAYGALHIGVRTLQVTDANRVDVLRTREGEPNARYDRRLQLEAWYPAVLAPGQAAGGAYEVLTRDPSVRATLRGRAVRDAAPLFAGAPFPLVIVSHGYPGNRFLMSHLCENLASKGYVVVSIDHPESTYDDQKGFASTLYNRPLDQLFVLNDLARMGGAGSGSFLSGLVDAERTAIIGYSMGGYGAVNVLGGGFSRASETAQGAPPNRLLAERGAASPVYRQSRDPRIKAAVAIGPWGMRSGMWDAEGLRGLVTPIMFVAGSVDDVSGYEQGTRAMFEGAVNADRYLLTYVNANHNAGAPMPAPAETFAYSSTLRSFPYTHYADPVWDTTRMNNILAHFTTAFLDLHLKALHGRKAFLEVVPDAKDAVYSVDRDGRPDARHTYWKGFKPRTAVGLKLEHAGPRR